jgi:anaerobic magnesium-protoporphyrin IX monomethyl ester cyclase
MRVALINAPLKSAVSDYGVGHQMPLGLLMVGGPLLDAGHQVKLIDAARDHLSDTEIIRRVAEFQADVAMTAHVGSTSAHPCAVRLLGAIRTALPDIVTVYGGVHPTYHYKTILAQHPEIDIIVRGEGEVTALELVEALAHQARERDGQPELPLLPDLSQVEGIAWRRDGQVVMNSPRGVIQDIDAHRIGWELIDDWDKYQAFGMGRSAVVQFSRGCPHTCTYCGQWMFWKHWRYRDVTRFADELEWLHRERGVNFFWLADENPTTIKELWQSALQEIIRRDIGISFSSSMRAKDIVRDADILHLYKEAGFLYILMGIETVTEDNLTKIRKGSSVEDGYMAVQLLRQNNIMSVVDYIFGIEDETPRTMWRGLRGLLRYGGDFVNALYMTPHAWTPFGRDTKPEAIVEHDLWKWDYRHQIIGVKHLTPTQLFIGVKLAELLYHLHPRRLWRILTVPDRRLRRQLRVTFWNTSAVFLYELYEHFSNRFRIGITKLRDRGVAPQPDLTGQPGKGEAH